MSSAAKYQRHVDGLRAVAVLAVILYHFSHRWFRGGYVGVDVFFVISGYLITRLILDEAYQTGRFDFRRFYVRRMRRLLPALFATLGISLALAIALFSPEQFQRFGRSLVAATLSCSNILFWTESGYFDVDAHMKPLLHTWSLGVEEQFYLFWPAFLWFVASRTDRRRHPYLIAAVGVVSLLLNGIWVRGNFDLNFRSTIFFLTPFRMFELALGGMAMFTASIARSRRWPQEIAMAAGLALIGYATVTYRDDLVFPYYLALVPCFGAFLVIVSGESRLAGRILTNRIAVGIGLISYSMYLVHWPALVFYEHYRFDDPGRRGYVGLFVLTVVTAALMHRFVETPFRRQAPSAVHAFPQRRFVVSCLSTALLIAMIGGQIGASSGWVWRDPRALTATAVAEGKKRRFDLFNAGCIMWNMASPSCRFDRPSQILFLGDSHEPDGYNAFAEIYGDSPTVNLVAFGSFNDCNVQFDASGPFSKVGVCSARVAILRDPKFVSSLTAVVLSLNRPYHESAEPLWRIINGLRAMNPRIAVAVIGGFLITNRDCSEVYSERHSFAACRDPQFVAFSAFNERATYTPPGDPQYVYIDRMRLLCSDGTLQSCTMEADGEPAFYDAHHLSFGFARYVGKRIVSVYGRELRAAGFPDPADSH